jgi:hypothetical protein
VSVADFVWGGPGGAGAQIFTPLPATGYQFALTRLAASTQLATPTQPAGSTQPAGQPAHAQRLRTALLRAVMALDQSDLAGAPAGRAAYEEIARRLEAAATDPRAAAQAGKWAAAVAPMLVKARQAAGTSLEAAAPEFPVPQQAALREAATRYNQFADRWQALTTHITAAAAATGPTPDWKALQAEATGLATDEQQTLRYLSATVGG